MDDTQRIAQALKRWKLADDAEADMRAAAKDDLRFRAGDQWDVKWKELRDSDRRPCITVNRIPQFVKQITNDQRQNRPSLHVIPTDDSEEETAEILEGMIRHIQVSSDSEIAADTACEKQVEIGFGYMRVATEYCHEMSFDQDIKIKRIKNPFTVYFDPSAIEPDYSDAKWCQIVDDVNREDLEAKYPDVDFGNENAFVGLGNEVRSWIAQETVRVSEYFCVEETEKTIYQLNDGSVVEKLPPGLKENGTIFHPQTMAAISVKRKRTTTKRKIMWYKLTAAAILEQKEWPGSYIPIIPVLGDEIELDGKRNLLGLIRFAKEPQKMYNYMVSAQVEAIALAPKAPYLAAEGQTEGHEEWDTLNTRNHGLLTYNPVSLNGVVIGAPQRQTAEPPIQAITIAVQQASQDLKNTTGIFDASLGNRSNETSGVAINARQRESDVANFNFVDNLSRSYRYLGVVLLDLIPRIYDAPRVVRITHEDKESKLVKINEIFNENNQRKIYDLSKGRYDVIVDTGPSYATKRIEASQTMLELAKANPQVWQIAGDLITANMDLAGSKEISERFKKTLPPQLQDTPEGQIELPPQVQQYIAQLEQNHDQLVEALNKANDERDQKVMELESRERIANANNTTKIITTGFSTNKDLLALELAHIAKRQAVLGAGQPIDDEEESQEPAQPGGMGVGPAPAGEPPVAMGG